MQPETNPNGDVGQAPEVAMKTDLKPLLAYLKAVEVAADRATVRFNGNKFSTLAVDPTNITQVEASMNVNTDGEPLNEELEYRLEIDRIVDNLSTLIEKERTSPSKVALTTDPKAFYYEVNGVEARHGSVDESAIRAEPAERSDVNCSFEATISAEKFEKQVKLINIAGQYIRLGYTPETDTYWMRAFENDDEDKLVDEFRPEETDEELGTVSLLEDKGDEYFNSIEESGTADTKLRAIWLKNILSVVPDDTLITIRTGVGQPIVIEYEIGTQPTNSHKKEYGTIKFVNAPTVKIEGAKKVNRKD